MPTFMVKWRITMEGTSVVQARTSEEAIKKVEAMDVSEDLWDPLSPSSCRIDGVGVSAKKD
jgi:hypothetical protein